MLLAGRPRRSSGETGVANVRSRALYVGGGEGHGGAAPCSCITFTCFCKCVGHAAHG